VTVRLLDETRVPVNAVTPLAAPLGLTVEDWAEYRGVPDHVWSNIRRHHADEEPGWGH
jgi:hypothetical protein